jgi:hypothetical protein
MTETQEIPWKRLAVEAVAIVGSILLAFAIDAWWEDVKGARQQAKLVASLQQDFETTKVRLEKSIEYADSLIARTSSFFEAVSSDELVLTESLRHFGGGVNHKIDFEPAMSAYEGAVATGELGQIKSPMLHKSITEFNEALDSYELHDRITADIHYLGPIWDVRRKYGSLSVLFDDPSAFPIPVSLTDTEIRQMYYDPLVTGAIEAVATANESIANNLRSMNEATAMILSELEQLQ